MASSHMLRVAAIIGYSGVLAVGLLFLPEGARGLILLFHSQSYGQSCGFRLPLIRLTRPEAVDSLSELSTDCSWAGSFDRLQ